MIAGEKILTLRLSQEKNKLDEATSLINVKDDNIKTLEDQITRKENEISEKNNKVSYFIF